MNRTKGVLVSVCLLLITLPLTASQPPDALDTVAATADSAYKAKDWAKATPLYEQLTQAKPETARNWYRLGVCRQETGKREEALDAFQKASDKGVPAFVVAYNMAEVYAAMGQSSQALAKLGEAVRQGYSQPDQMKSDEDLLSIRGDARFADLLEQARRNQTPCAYKPENRQFDFWVGDWDVVAGSGGSPAGKSHIERTIGDCVIWENWTSLGPGGYEGKSYNIYNPNLNRWEQFWVDNSGGMIHFYGGLKDGVMDFFTDDVPQSGGGSLKRHLQFFNLGLDKVRQFSQGSKDGGKTWNVEYDLTYLRRK